MFVHRMCPKSTELVVCEGNWSDLLPDKSVVGLQVVRSNPESFFIDTNGKFVACEPYN